MDAGQEYILNLQRDDPLVIAAKLIVTMTGEIFRYLHDGIRDTRKRAEAALSALRLFELEDLYRECYSGDGVMRGGA